MPREITYTYCGGMEQRSSDVGEMHHLVQMLTTPKAMLLTNTEGFPGYLDFFVLDDGSIEMEIMEDDDNFASVDVAVAARVIEIVMTDIRDIPLREKLHELPIHWLT